MEHSTRQFKLRIPFAVTTLQDALSDRFGVYFRSSDAVTARVRALGMASPGDEDFVKESDVLRVAIDEWTLQRERLEQILEAVYVAGDLNGDGGLEFDEFAAVVAHLSPTVDDKLLLKVFAAAHDVVKLPRRISFTRFLDVILLERILNASGVGTTSMTASRVSSGSAANNSSSTGTGGPTGHKTGILGDDSSSNRTAAGGSSSTARSYAPGAVGSKATSALAAQEDDEPLQFNLLQQTWAHDRDIVERALKLITHAPTAASLTFRVSFLSQLLAKRVDAKTAWMCHRQIMRDISRFQDLDEAQIVVLKTKDETFRKAVLAITNLRKLGTVLGGSHTSTEAEQSSGVGDSESAASSSQSLEERTTEALDPTLDERQYTATVERTFDGLEHHSESQLGDMLELEDELREKFLASADEGAIEDFKDAVQQLRRMSRLSDSNSFALEVSREQLEDLEASRQLEEEGEGDEKDEDEDDDEDDEE